VRSIGAKRSAIFLSAGDSSRTIGHHRPVWPDQVVKDSPPERWCTRSSQAFVATIYGFACANLFFCRWPEKIKARALRRPQLRELIVEGVIGQREGLKP